MRKAIIFFFLFALFIPIAIHAGENARDVTGSPSRHGENIQLAQSDRDRPVSNKLPFNLSNGLYMSRCITSAQASDAASTIKDCSAAIESDPGNSLAYRLRSVAYAAAGNTQQAIRDCKAGGMSEKECVDWFRRAAEEAERKKQAAAGEKNGDERNLRLSCKVVFDNGAPGDYSITVDLSIGTVNGWKARIGEDMIYWTQQDSRGREDAWFQIDRYTGVFKGANIGDRGAYSGKCEKAENKQF